MRFVGVDLGLKRIGLAVSDRSGTLARPLRTLTRSGSDDDQGAAAAIADAVGVLAGEEDGVDAVVVGLPTRLDGSETDQTAHVRRMVDHLRSLVEIPIALQDERLSSREAESRLALRERDWRTRKARLDAAAAAVILQDYLDARATAGRSSPASIQD
jgi:putative Holliday junction resolvase